MRVNIGFEKAAQISTTNMCKHLFSDNFYKAVSHGPLSIMFQRDVLAPADEMMPRSI